MWVRRILQGTVLVLALSAPLAPAGAAVDDAVLNGAREFVTDMSSRVLKVITDPESTKRDRLDALRNVFNEGFDVKSIARFVLGRYWRLATQDEKDEYVVVFEDYVVRTYAARFDSYSGQDFVISNVRPDGETGALVMSEIISRDGNSIRVDWRIRRPKGEFAVVDVLVEGVSMAVTQRSEFASVMQQNAGKLSSLVNTLKEKSAELSSRVDAPSQ